MKRIRVPLKDRSYDIVVGRGLLKNCGAEIKRLALGSDAIVITNKRLAGLYKGQLESSLKRSGFTVRFELVPDSEKAKSIAVATRLLAGISAYDVHKSIFIIAFGGGVVGDLAGFVAASYKRGVPYVQVPTTLLAQVDSAIGGKVAVDLPVAKNLVGAFYQPRLVLSDVSLIKSLPLRQIRNGLAEVIKYGVIKDRSIFAFLEANCRKVLNGDGRALEYLIARCSRIKAGVVAKDERDAKGVRAILNYGHTMGHAIEAASGYSNRYNHGEAVAIGMIIASRVSASLGRVGPGEVLRIEALVRMAGLPVIAKGLKFGDIYKAHLHDKKFVRGKNRFVLPVKIGAVKVVEGVPDALVKSALKKHLSDQKW